MLPRLEFRDRKSTRLNSSPGSISYAVLCLDKKQLPHRPHESTIARGKLLVFFFNDTATTEIYTLSLHDALPISELQSRHTRCYRDWSSDSSHGSISYAVSLDRKSTRLNSSHGSISYAVFCL